GEGGALPRAGGEADAEAGAGEGGVVAQAAEHRGPDVRGGGGAVVVEGDDQVAGGPCEGELLGGGAHVPGEPDDLRVGAGVADGGGGEVGGGVVDDDDLGAGGDGAEGLAQGRRAVPRRDDHAEWLH